MAQTTNTMQPEPGTALFSSFGYQLSLEWGWVAFRGVCAVLFGVLAFFWPLATVLTLAVFWGAFALVDGISAGITGWRMYKRGVSWWPYMGVAFIGVAAGLFAFLWPGLTAIGLVYVIAFWAIFGGLSQITAAIRLRREIAGEGYLIFAGAVSVLFGILVAFRPLPEGVVAIAWLVGAYALVVGVLYIMLAFKLRNHGKSQATV